MSTEEDDEFKRIEMESGWRKRQVATTIQVPDLYRNYIIDEIAEQLEKINHSTSQHYAEFIKKLKR
jgi:ribosomal 50S subunit-associated protein YjgA (DUF615 family)